MKKLILLLLLVGSELFAQSSRVTIPVTNLTTGARAISPEVDTVPGDRVSAKFDWAGVKSPNVSVRIGVRLVRDGVPDTRFLCSTTADDSPIVHNGQPILWRGISNCPIPNGANIRARTEIDVIAGSVRTSGELTKGARR